MRILFIANVWSIHTARWVSQISDQNWDIHLFPSRDLEINPLFNNVTIHDINRRPLDLPATVKLQVQACSERLSENFPRKLIFIYQRLFDQKYQESQTLAGWMNILKFKVKE